MINLWLRSVARRPSTTVLLFLLSSVAVLSAMLGPVLVRAVQQSTLADGVAVAGLDGSSMSVTGQVEAGQPYDVSRAPAEDSLAAGVEPNPTLWQPTEVLISSRTNLYWAERGDLDTTVSAVNAIDAGCGNFAVTAGGCPTAKDQTMVSTGDATLKKVKVGDTITFRLPQLGVTSLKIVGLYDAGRSEAARLTRPGTTDGVLAGVTGDPLVMITETSADLPLAVDITARTRLQPGVTVADIDVLQDTIDTVRAASNTQGEILEFQSTLPDVLDTVQRQSASAQVLILITAVQSFLLAIFALGIVLQRVGRARASEWSVGRLRGVPRPRWLASIYAEPVVALLLGLPAGFLAGTGVARLAIDLTLRPGTAAEVWRTPVLGAAAAATVVALLAVVAVSLRSVRLPLAEIVQQQAESPKLTPLQAVAYAAVLLLSAATLYQLLAGGLLSSSGPQLGLLAPGLFALAVALIAVRGSVLAVRRVTTRPPRGLGALVVGRHAARLPSSLNPAMVTAVAMALIVFAVQILLLSERNQGLRADANVGASTVFTVGVPGGTDLLAAVREADPDGRNAMAVRQTVGSNGSSRIVAVDSTRLDAVAAWSPEWSGLGDLATALRGPTTEPITLRGTSVELDLARVVVQPQPLPNPQAVGAVYPAPPPSVLLTVESGDRWQTVDLGPLPRSAATLKLRGAIDCSDGCRLVQVGLRSGANQPYKATLTVTGIGTDTAPAAASKDWLAEPDRWREQSVNANLGDETLTATPEPGTTGLGLAATDLEGGGLAAVSPTDTIDPIPAVLGPETELDPYQGEAGVGIGTGLDNQQQKLRVLGTASVLPRLLDDGVLMDLSNAQGIIDPSTRQVIDQVWLTPDAPASVEQALRDEGLLVTGRQSLAANRTALENQATTRGAAAAVVSAAAALLLALITAVAARWADAGRRGADWRALREAGLRRSTLRRLAATEIAVPTVLGVVLGALSGAVAARIAASRLPLVDLNTPGPPLDLRLEWPPIIALAAAMIIVTLIIAVVGALAETRSGEET